MISGSGSPRERTWPARRPRYEPSSGDSAASRTVVAVRSYSRKVPTSSDDRETCVPGMSSASSPPSMRSWAPSRYEWSSATATASGSERARRRTSDRAVSGSSACSGPSGPIRSGVPKRSSAGTSGAGGPTQRR